MSSALPDFDHLSATQSLKSNRPYDLETSRLYLSLHEPNNPVDTAKVISVYNDPVSLAINGDLNIHSNADVEARRLRMIVSPEACRAAELPPPPSIWWLVHLKPDHADRLAAVDGLERAPTAKGEFLGTVAMMQRSPSHPPDLGYAFLSPHHGKGYATEASGALLDFWRTTMKVPQIWAGTFKVNAASQRVCAKLGFEKGPETTITLTEGDRRDVITWLMPGMSADFMGTVDRSILPPKAPEADVAGK